MGKTKVSVSMFDFPMERKNCVCCHIWRNLTKHHIFPTEFIPFIPNLTLKNNEAMLCGDHHTDYEQHNGNMTRLDIINECFSHITGAHFESIASFHKFLDFARRYKRTGTSWYSKKSREKAERVLISYSKKGFDYNKFYEEFGRRDLSIRRKIPSELLLEFIDRIGEKSFALLWKDSFERWIMGKDCFAGNEDLRSDQRMDGGI